MHHGADCCRAWFIRKYLLHFPDKIFIEYRIGICDQNEVCLQFFISVFHAHVVAVAIAAVPGSLQQRDPRAAPDVLLRLLQSELFRDPCCAPVRGSIVHDHDMIDTRKTIDAPYGSDGCLSVIIIKDDSRQFHADSNRFL